MEGGLTRMAGQGEIEHFETSKGKGGINTSMWIFSSITRFCQGDVMILKSHMPGKILSVSQVFEKLFLPVRQF